MTARKLTERRAADRKAMADAIAALAEERGWKCEVEALNLDASVVLDGPRGLGCSLLFEHGSFMPDEFVIAWNIREGDARLSDAFGYVQGAKVNEFHRRKCTTVAHGFDHLRQLIASGMDCAGDGSAFV